MSFPTFQTISKKGWVETISFPFLLITFSKSLYYYKKVQKVDKIVDIHFFENVVFEKYLSLPAHVRLDIIASMESLA